MPFTPKKNDKGDYVWEDSKPVYVNSETGKDLSIDVDQLFSTNAKLGTEAHDNRVAKQEAETKLKLWGELDPTQVSADLKAFGILKASKNGDATPPSEEELNVLVQRKYEASLLQIQGQKDAVVTQNEKLTKELKTSNKGHDELIKTTKIDAAMDKVENLNSACREDVRNKLAPEFDVVEMDGDKCLIMRDSQGNILKGTDPTLPLSPLERINVLVRDDKKHWLIQPNASPHISSPGATGTDFSKMSTSQLFAHGLKTE